MPNHVYAVLWEARQGPWENGAFRGPGSGLFESTDGGNTWRPLTKGLPTFEQGLGRIGITIAPSDPNAHVRRRRIRRDRRPVPIRRCGSDAGSRSPTIRAS